MRANRPNHRNRLSSRLGSNLLLLAAVCLPAAGCVDSSLDPPGVLTARLSLAAVLLPGENGQASQIDAWRVLVIRPSEGVIADETGPLSPGQSTANIEIAVALNAVCENLIIQVDLLAAGEVWYHSQENHRICSGKGSDVEVVELAWVRPPASVGPESLTFTVQEGEGETQSIEIQYGGADGLAWSVWIEEPGVDWVSLEPSSGSIQGGQPAQVQVLVDAGSLGPGAYSAHIAVAGEGFPELIARVPLALTVTPGPVLGVAPPSLSFSVAEGTTPEPKTLTVTNQGGGTLNWGVSVDADWLTLEPADGSLGPSQTQVVTVSPSPDGLPLGQHLATITVSADQASGSPQTIPVSLTKNPGPRIGLSTSTLSFRTSVGTNPAARQLTVSNIGGGLLSWSATVDAAWLSVEPGAGSLGASLSQSVTAGVNADGLKPGTYVASITFSDLGASNSPQVVSVNLRVTGETAPTISGLSWEQLQLNDTTCGNLGTRFELYFNYSDPDGDILIAGDSLAGTPIELDWWFRPDGFSGSSSLTAAVDGTGSSGSVSFQMCIAYQVKENTSVDLTFRLTDGAGLQSNSLFTNIPRPAGGNVPPPEPTSADGIGAGNASEKRGTVVSGGAPTGPP